MKIILSRKGFDSAHGGIASPVFPGGEMLSFPIPGTNPAKGNGGIYYPGIWQELVLDNKKSVNWAKNIF
jgi:hypothetical protein